MYEYRKLTPQQQQEAVKERRLHGAPEHEPPHFTDESGWFLISASTFEHTPHLSEEDDRRFVLDKLVANFAGAKIQMAAWVVLPNHYHILFHCGSLKDVVEPIRKTHGSSSHRVNKRDHQPGRTLWYRYTDRQIRSERHFYTTINYIHFNPVKHGYVEKPLDWECSSVHWYMERYGKDWLREMWIEHPVHDYGKGSDW